MKKLLILILPLLFSGCLYFNDRGLDNNYYNQCKEYYDSVGVYHKTCDENIVDYKTVTDGTKKAIDTTGQYVKDSATYIKNGTKVIYNEAKELVTQ